MVKIHFRVDGNVCKKNFQWKFFIQYPSLHFSVHAIKSLTVRMCCWRDYIPDNLPSLHHTLEPRSRPSLTQVDLYGFLATLEAQKRHSGRLTTTPHAARLGSVEKQTARRRPSPSVKDFLKEVRDRGVSELQDGAAESFMHGWGIQQLQVLRWKFEASLHVQTF